MNPEFWRTLYASSHNSNGCLRVTQNELTLGGNGKVSQKELFKVIFIEQKFERYGVTER